MVNELEAFSHIAEKFIATESRQVLSQFKGTLETYRDQPTQHKFDWQIRPANPLRTTVSPGGYEMGSKGAHHIFAEIDALWRIQRVPGKKKNDRSEFFKLVDIGSTRVRLFCVPQGKKPKREIAMWRMEVGDAQSPGCHFHTQILGEQSRFPFPKSLSIPRLPGLLLTTAAVTEFVLAELFQEDWAKHVSADTPHLQRWAPIQNKRLKKMLNWELGLLNKGGSPWTTLKRNKPDESLFI